MLALYDCCSSDELDKAWLTDWELASFAPNCKPFGLFRNNIFRIWPFYKIYVCEDYSFMVLCGCEKWSLTLHRLRVPENRLMRKIFGPKKEEVIGGWNLRLSPEDFHNLEITLMKEEKTRECQS
jgi:hypothetical protein